MCFQRGKKRRRKNGKIPTKKFTNFIFLVFFSFHYVHYFCFHVVFFVLNFFFLYFLTFCIQNYSPLVKNKWNKKKNWKTLGIAPHTQYASIAQYRTKSSHTTSTNKYIKKYGMDRDMIIQCGIKDKMRWHHVWV